MDIPFADVVTSTSRREASTAQGARRTAVVVKARYYGTAVEETFIPRNAFVQIGNSPAMTVPVPAGLPWLARIYQVGHHRYLVEDPRGVRHPLEACDVHTITVGQVTLELRVVERVAHRRMEAFQLWGSFAWFTVVFAATLLAMQGDVVVSHSCEWFGMFCPPPATGQDGGALSPFSAEYLARLLREDYAGEEDGAIQKEDRELGDRKNESFYMPAGGEGPATKMGGSEETAAREIRTPKPSEQEAKAKPPDPVQVASDDGASDVPVVDPSDEPAPDANAITSSDEGDDVAESDSPAEDHEGWGVQDWYDADDSAYEHMEIQYMLAAASARLRIDPNDPDALSVLSYYQYLAQDYDAAEKTYDKFIGLFPDESSGYNNKALIYKREGDYAKEEGLYRVALALQPDDVIVLNNLAVCVAHQGRFDEAHAIMDRLEVLDPDDPYADLHRAKIAAAQGDDEQSYAYLQKALDGMQHLDTLHHIEFRQDIRLDPAFEHLRQTRRFHAILARYYGDDSPLQEGG